MIQGYSRFPELDARGNAKIRTLFDQAVPIMREVFTSVPTTNTLPQGWAALYVSGATRRLYFNLQGTICYTELST